MMMLAKSRGQGVSVRSDDVVSVGSGDVVSVGSGDVVAGVCGNWEVTTL
jgi:hypothetical protein